jgi:hypothetical protein
MQRAACLSDAKRFCQLKGNIASEANVNLLLPMLLECVEGLEAHLRLFLTSALDGGEQSTSQPRGEQSTSQPVGSSRHYNLEVSSSRHHNLEVSSRHHNLEVSSRHHNLEGSGGRQNL